MAEKKANDEPAEEFQPPAFDEDAFIHKEMTSFRATVILFCTGIVAAVLSWAAFAYLDGAQIGWTIGLGICAAGAFGLKWLLPRFGAEIGHYKRKEWFGTTFMFFMTWLSFFMVAVNPPISDFAAPQIEIRVSPSIPEPGSEMAIHVLAADNVRLAGAPTLTVLRDGNPVAATLAHDGNDHYIAKLTAESGRYAISVTASDGRHEGSGSANVTVQDILAVTPKDLLATGDQILVTAGPVKPCPKAHPQSVGPCFTRVVLVGPLGNITLSHDVQQGAWRATANYAGFVPDTANYTVHATFVDHFLGARRVVGGELVAGPYTIKANPPIGGYIPDADAGGPIQQPNAPERVTPGLEAVAAIAALAVAAIFLRRRQA